MREARENRIRGVLFHIFKTLGNSNCYEKNSAWGGREMWQVAGGGITKGMNRLGDEGYVHYLECDDGFTDVFICQNLECAL